jgi:hypothetical protein
MILGPYQASQILQRVSDLSYTTGYREMELEAGDREVSSPLVDELPLVHQLRQV